LSKIAADILLSCPVELDEADLVVIRLQRFCGHPCRRDARRGRSNRSVSTPATKWCRWSGAVFPSLRAHEPNPAGLEIHPDLAGLGNSTELP
jgi:hypothetical protein